MLLTIAVLLISAGVLLLLNVGGAATAVIRRVTSKNLGQLPAGYAASVGGLRVYAVLLIAIGLATAGFAIAPASPVAGLAAILLGAIAFAVASGIAILGEVRTYRALQRGSEARTRTDRP